jgi:hypothetical protein
VVWVVNNMILALAPAGAEAKNAPSLRRAHFRVLPVKGTFYQSYPRWVAMEVKVESRPEATSSNTVTSTRPIAAAIRPYSIAVAPDSSLKNLNKEMSPVWDDFQATLGFR